MENTISKLDQSPENSFISSCINLLFVFSLDSTYYNFLQPLNNTFHTFTERKLCFTISSYFKLKANTQLDLSTSIKSFIMFRANKAKKPSFMNIKIKI